MTWARRELEKVQLGDRRLNERLFKISEHLVSHPSQPISRGQEDRAGSKAAYRFFENDKVDETHILQAHVEKTCERILRAKDVVLAIQDTTFVNHTKHGSIEGLGKHGPSSGLHIHSTLAISTTGISHGLLHQKIFSHEPPTKGAKKTWNYVPIEKKESYRWIESIHQTKKVLGERASQVVHVGDREADMFDLFYEAQESGVSFLVRANHDRRMKAKIFPELKKEYSTRLWRWMAKQEVAGNVSVDVPAAPGRAARIANCEIRFSPVKFNPRRKLRAAQSKIMRPVQIFAIWLSEKNPPEKDTPLEWMLLTNLELNSFASAIEKIEWYRCRWQIEIFHKILKSGCRIEDCRLNSLEKQKKYLTLMSIVAYRLHWLTWVGRISKETPCTTALSDTEWKALYCHKYKTNKLPDKPPTIQEAIRWIALFGGFLGRKGDGNPGILSIWTGWQKLTQMVQMYELLQPDPRLRATYG